MRRSSQTPTGVIGKLFVSLFFLVFLGMGSFFVWFIARDAVVGIRIWTWKQAPCEILASAVRETEEPGQRVGNFEFEVRYRYRFGGQTFTSEQYRRNPKPFSDYAKAARLTQRYSPGSSARCYVNPSAAAEAVLEQLRYQLRGVSWEKLLAACEALRYRAAVVGPHGSGKTTLLEDLGRRLRERGFRTRFIRLDAEHRIFPPETIEKLFASIAGDTLLLFDGAEQMNPVAWRWFRWRTRKAAGLIITTHQSGRLPTLWKCRTTPELLAEIAAELLETRSDTISGLASDLFCRHHGNLRDALREWYDLAAAA